MVRTIKFRNFREARERTGRRRVKGNREYTVPCDENGIILPSSNDEPEIQLCRMKAKGENKARKNAANPLWNALGIITTGNQRIIALIPMGKIITNVI
jgi:hypothetical protein